MLSSNIQKVRWPSWLWRQVKVIKTSTVVVKQSPGSKEHGFESHSDHSFCFFVPFTHDDANMLHGEQFDSMFLKLWWLRRCAKISDFSLSRLLGRSREINFPRLCFLSF